jgi:hypothetical protein
VRLLAALTLGAMAAAIVYFVAAAVTSIFTLAGWHLPWS